MIEKATPIPGVREYIPTIHSDSRGLFLETFRQDRICSGWVQDNLSFTQKRGTFRGFHAQKPPHAQAKLVRCVRGQVLDIVIDIRSGSPTYLHTYSVVLSDQIMNMLYVPKGFLHGFYTLTDDVMFEYKVSEYYNHKSNVVFGYNDPIFNVPSILLDDNIHVSMNDDPDNAIVVPFNNNTNPFIGWE